MAISRCGTSSVLIIFRYFLGQNGVMFFGMVVDGYPPSIKLSGHKPPLPSLSSQVPFPSQVPRKGRGSEHEIRIMDMNHELRR